MNDVYLLVGLGNPGVKYKNTRHNLGFRIVEKIAEVIKCRFKSGKGEYLIAESTYSGKRIILAKPLTFMNKSGVAVLDLIQRYNVPQTNLLVILDDINLPFGKFRFRSKGRDGGHNGLASIIYQLKSEAFPRFRVGVGKENMRDPVEFVLSNFDKEERKELPRILNHAAKACLDFVAEGIEKTMNQYN
jgi:PTH1 family peptidyl-tRNA hydrolase